MTKYRNQSRLELLQLIKTLNDERNTLETCLARYRDIIQALEEETARANPNRVTHHKYELGLPTNYQP